MTKTNDDLNQIKSEYESLAIKLNELTPNSSDIKELNDDELNNVVGGKTDEVNTDVLEKMDNNENDDNVFPIIQ